MIMIYSFSYIVDILLSTRKAVEIRKDIIKTGIQYKSILKSVYLYNTKFCPFPTHKKSP